MARSIATIQAQIIAAKQAQSALNGLTSTSQVSIWNLWTYVTAVAMFFQESLWDLFETNLEVVIAAAPVGTDAWLANQSFLFQYDASTPQIVTLTNFVPSYNPIDTTKQIITRASVKTLPSRFVQVKIAKSNPPVALTAPELNSFTGYLNEISFAGVQINATSTNPDLLEVSAQVFYNGQYAAVIQATVIASINTYLQGVPFDGFIRLSKLEEAILNTPGVSDMEFTQVILRPTGTYPANQVFMVNGNTEYFTKLTMSSGYAIPETQSGHDLASTLTFIPA
jgi:hypothetical protein